MTFNEHQTPFLMLNTKNSPYIDCIRFPDEKIVVEVNDQTKTPERVKADLKTTYGFTDDQLCHVDVSIIPCSKEEMKTRFTKAVKFLGFFEKKMDQLGGELDHILNYSLINEGYDGIYIEIDVDDKKTIDEIIQELIDVLGVSPEDSHYFRFNVKKL